ncbi:MAG: hypothetical protein HY685_02965 [Chloroflexi bacterium]|nr:hypothetical protein [Chloroflexota bacterium]
MSVLVFLALLGLFSAVVLALGARQGRAGSNPWWLIMSGATVILTLHVFGLFSSDAGWVPWAAALVALVAAVPAGLRERSLWRSGMTAEPRLRDTVLEIVAITIGVILAIILEPQVPGPDQLTIRLTVLVLALVPLLTLRYVVSRYAPARSPQG